LLSLNVDDYDRVTLVVLLELTSSITSLKLTEGSIGYDGIVALASVSIFCN